MNTEKVDAFPTPHFFSGTTGGIDLNVSTVLPAIFAIVFFVWAAYTVVVAYHWFRYGHQSFLAVPLLIIHLLVSGCIMLMTVAGLK